MVTYTPGSATSGCAEAWPFASCHAFAALGNVSPQSSQAVSIGQLLTSNNPVEHRRSTKQLAPFSHSVLWLVYEAKSCVPLLIFGFSLTFHVFLPRSPLLCLVVRRRALGQIFACVSDLGHTFACSRVFSFPLRTPTVSQNSRVSLGSAGSFAATHLPDCWSARLSASFESCTF